MIVWLCGCAVACVCAELCVGGVCDVCVWLIDLMVDVLVYHVCDMSRHSDILPDVATGCDID